MTWDALHDHIAHRARAERDQIHREARDIRACARRRILWLALPINYEGGWRAPRLVTRTDCETQARALGGGTTSPGGPPPARASSIGAGTTAGTGLSGSTRHGGQRASAQERRAPGTDLPPTT